MLFAAFLLGAQHERNSVKNKPASSLIVSLDKVLNRTLPPVSGRQAVGPAKQSSSGSSTD